MSRSRHLGQEGEEELPLRGRAKRVTRSGTKRNQAKRTSLNMAKQVRIEDRGNHIATQIALGNLTRERSCDGKARFTTYDYAERVGREEGAKFGKAHTVYPCPFCDGYHLASVVERVS